MSRSNSLHNSLQDVISGEDEETESEEEDGEYEVIDKENVTKSIVNNDNTDDDKKENINSSIKKQDDEQTDKNDNTNNSNNKSNITNTKEIHQDNLKNKIKNITHIKHITHKKPHKKPQFKEIRSQSKFSKMKMGFGKILNSGKKIVQQNFGSQKNRGKWENAINEATRLFHEKLFKSISCNLTPIKKQTAKSTQECQECVGHLHRATSQIDQASNKIKAFCDEDKFKLKTLY